MGNSVKIAAKLAVGYLLDEIKNDITREPPRASSRPLITSSPIPLCGTRFGFEKFPQACKEVCRALTSAATDEKCRRRIVTVGSTFKESPKKCPCPSYRNGHLTFAR